MALLLRNGIRLDIELAVALELASARIQKAASLPERQQAIAFNEALWTSIRRLVSTAPDLDCREDLRRAALSASDREEDMVQRNGACARILAGRAATGGALKALLNDWRAYLRMDPKAEFGSWLLHRMEEDLVPLAA